MELYDNFLFNIEIESLAHAHLRREEACRRRAAMLIAQAERHNAIAKRLWAMHTELPWADTVEYHDLSSHFSTAFSQALVTADQFARGPEESDAPSETPDWNAEPKEGWPDPGAEIPF